MTNYDHEAISQLEAMDGQSGALRSAELVEDVDGVPAGVQVTEHEPALIVVPWGLFGLPSRAEVYGDEDGAA